MKPRLQTLRRPALGLALLATLVAACDSDDLAPPPVAQPAPPTTVSFEVTVTNLTNAQPLSPVAVISHRPDYRVFALGEPSTLGLEELAEDGANATLLDEAFNAGAYATVSGAGPIAPGGNETLMLQFLEDDLATAMLSVSTMLVNTNDAITGVNAYALTGLGVGESTRLTAIAYDAGTEANTEEAIHIPGPAGGGEGFNAARDDRFDRVTMHAGVVGNDDGFASSDLDNQHRFDNPVATVTITRID